MHILHLEDADNDALLIGRQLAQAWPDSRIERVRVRPDYEAALERGGFDLILSDYSMPSYDGLAALDLARARCPEKPFIFISGTIGEERAIEALKRGAADYVIKDRPARLVPAIRQALAFAEEADRRRLAETEKKKLEANILRAQRMENIGMIAGGVAHDLNNALSPILMATELLQADCANADQRMLLDMIRKGAQRGADMVKQVLTFARGIGEARGVIQVSRLLREMLDICRQTFPKTIEIRTDIAQHIWPLMADSTQLHQVLLNLCINARDAMPSGGCLTLGAGNVTLGEADAPIVPEATAGPHVVMSVADTGSGMAPEVVARIFEPFFTTKASDKGTGLGLSTVQTIVKAHGGVVTVESALGAGTTFKIYLPAETAAAAAPLPKRPAHPVGNGELILVVDDEAAICNIASQTLEMFGYHVLTAGDGAQAVALCVQHKAKLRLMITDMTMPVMDGLATIRAVRSIAGKIKIITASGMESNPSRTAAERQEIQGRLQKPYSADQLLQTVHDVLSAEP